MNSKCNFYPGPSRLAPNIDVYLHNAYDSGLLEANHRSSFFMDFLKETIQNTKAKLDIPDKYEVFFTSSATECWEITVQSLLHNKVQFLYSGAFGKKWFKYGVINPQAISELNKAKSSIRGTRFFVDQSADEVEIDSENSCLCIVSSETSNGTQITNQTIRDLKTKMSTESLILVDATSSLGGIAHDISLADVWFGSSQKCFGLPSGLGIMIVSPKAIEKAKEINERNHYNSLLNISENFQKNQTHYTPNTLGIFLFSEVIKNRPHILKIDSHLKTRAKHLYNEMSQCSFCEPLVTNLQTRSDTVLAFTSERVGELHKYLSEKDIIVGKGYGEWKSSSFRIANFPSIPDVDFDLLLKTLKSF